MQGIGIVGEVPVAAAYIGELSKAKRRGRFVLLYELVFPAGPVFAVLGGFAALGALFALFGEETSGRTLEELSA